VTTTAICGSDLHIYGGYIPTMQRSDILGHEFMGEGVAVAAVITHRVALDDAPRMYKTFREKEDSWQSEHVSVGRA